MKKYNSELPDYKTLCMILQKAADEVFPFLQILLREPLYAETIGIEVLLLALENSWLEYGEFRYEILALSWKKAKGNFTKSINLENTPFLEDKMLFYAISAESRAALYLRTKLQVSYEDIQKILELPSIIDAKELVQEAREKILGRKIKYQTDFLAE